MARKYRTIHSERKVGDAEAMAYLDGPAFGLCGTDCRSGDHSVVHPVGNGLGEGWRQVLLSGTGGDEVLEAMIVEGRRGDARDRRLLSVARDLCAGWSGGDFLRRANSGARLRDPRLDAIFTPPAVSGCAWA